MAIQTKNSTATTRNSRNQQYCFGMGEHQSHNLTGSKRQFVKIRNIYTKEKRKIWDDEIKLFVQQNNLACKNYLPTKTMESEIEYKHRRALAKREDRKKTSKFLGRICITLIFCHIQNKTKQI